MNITLDRRSKTPLSQQVEIDLRLKMIRGELQPGFVLPSEIELSAELGISSNEVLKAYEALTNGNHLALKNKTWVVSFSKVSRIIFEKFTSLVDIIKLTGSTPKINTLIVSKDYKYPKDLGVEMPQGKILYARRLYYGNDKPMVLADCYFPQELFPNFDHILKSNEPYYDLFKSKFNLDFSRSERTIEALNLRKKEADIFEVPVGSAYSYSIVKTYHILNRLIEVNVCWLMPDAMHFTIEQDE
jgi:DNA-binding GntR family transcriptional regulator